jgi:hypothetical protein
MYAAFYGLSLRCVLTLQSQNHKPPYSIAPVFRTSAGANKWDTSPYNLCVLYQINNPNCYRTGDSALGFAVYYILTSPRYWNHTHPRRLRTLLFDTNALESGD